MSRWGYRSSDYYAVLGVGNDASEEEIKRSYRNMAKKYHPGLMTMLHSFTFLSLIRMRLLIFSVQI